MKTEIPTTDKEKELADTGNTDHLRTVPGTERVIADPVQGEPVIHNEDHTTDSIKNSENLMHVNLAKSPTNRS
ncbi:MAG: hypothetical protein ACJATT_005228 [Myxococcota bacterium]|jgi:hypothetical protein